MSKAARRKDTGIVSTARTAVGRALGKKKVKKMHDSDEPEEARLSPHKSGGGAVPGALVDTEMGRLDEESYQINI